MRLRIALALMLLTVGCGSSPTAPAPLPPPPASVAGSFSGTLSSSNWATTAVVMNLTQAGTAVTGTWAGTQNDWNGTISGTVDTASFTGTFTLSAPNAAGVGQRCTGTASLSGGAVGVTLGWTSPGFTGSCTGMPLNVRFDVQRR